MEPSNQNKFSHAPDDQVKESELSDQIVSDLGVIRAQVNMDVAFISEFKHGQRVFRYVNSDTELSSIKALDGDPLEETLCRLVVDERIPGFIQDIDTLEITKNAKSASRLNIRSYLGVPIRLTNGELYGTLCCFSHSPQWDLNEHDIEIMKIYAAMTAKRLEKDIAQEKENQVIESRVKKMLDSDELTIVYQPIFNLSSEQNSGYEALSRFHQRSTIAPDAWFNDAAKVNLTVEIEIKAIELALKALESLPESVYLSINSSAETILSNQLGQTLKKYPLNRIVLEITEHQSIEEYEAIKNALKPFRQQGLKLAVDDAGAGYASFRHILALAPEYIKIDISIIRNIHLDLAKQSLTKAFLAFADQTNSKLIAEGVEYNDELIMLKKLGVHSAQGYLLGKPGPL